MKETIEKIKSEMETEKNPYVDVIGAFLLDQLKKQPDIAEKLSDEEKTIKGSLLAMRDEAKKKAVDGMAVLTDEEGFAIVMEYFEIDAECAEVVTKSQPNVTKKAKSVTKPKQTVPDGQIDIFDLMGDVANAN